MRGQLAGHQAVRGKHAVDVVAVGLALRGGGHVEQALVPGRDLQGLEAHARGPARNVLQRIERCLVIGELRKMKAWPLDCLHVFFLALRYCLLIDKEWYHANAVVFDR